MDLPQYKRLKFSVADALRVAIARAQPGPAGRQNDIRGLFARLAEDRCNLAVAGRFSRGKTALMDAIPGMDKLPTEVVPLTSGITILTYRGDEPVGPE